MTPLVRTRQFGYKRLRLLSRPVIALPLTVLIVFILLSVAATVLAQNSLESTRQHAIVRRTQEDALQLANTISAYTLIASGGAGFVESADVTADNWASFVSAYDINNNYSAINAVTYAQLSDPHTLITTYTYPQSPALISRLGLNEYTTGTRGQAIDEAIQSGTPSLTDAPQQIRPQNSSGGESQPGDIIFAPIYDTSKPLSTPDERRAALLGTANVSFQTATFFSSIYAASETQTHTYMTIYQGPNEQSPEVYQGGVHPAAGDAVDYVQHVPYDNQIFTYHYQFSDADLLTLSERTRPLLTLVAGVFLGVLLSAIMLFLIRARLHKLSSDKEREIQLAKDELLSLASHQLRTPATGVKQYMGMVLQGFAGDITEQQKDFLQKAYDSNDRQLHIINDILHLAKLDAGRIVLTKTTFDISELVRSVVDEQESAAADGEVGLTHRLPKKLSVYADSHMMRMVIENLVSNAIKYTNPGGKVSVSLKSTKEAVEVAVRDTGVGISDSDLDKLFKQFSRVANERSHLVSGTGVGLYLAKNLIELHGGSVDVSSRAGRGTTFTLRLPN